jgi:hypothetical protein
MKISMNVRKRSKPNSGGIRNLASARAALLQRLKGVAKNDVIDFGRREPLNVDRRLEQDQFFKLNLQRVQIPLPWVVSRVSRARLEQQIRVSCTISDDWRRSSNPSDRAKTRQGWP